MNYLYNQKKEHPITFISYNSLGIPIYYVQYVYSLYIFIFCRYNNLNVDQILSNERLVTNYVECLLSRKPCTPEGKDLKRKSFIHSEDQFRNDKYFCTEIRIHKLGLFRLRNFLVFLIES